MRFLIAYLLLFLLTPLYGTADDGTIRGRITDKSTGEPLPGAYIIYGQNLGTVSNDDGTYLVTTTPGRVRISFQLIGYETLTREIHLSDGENIELNIELEIRISEIDQIVVSASRTEQKIAELSVSMNIIRSAFLSANHISDAQELMNKTPGIEVLDGQASIRGGSGFSYGVGSRVLALIDGLPVASADAGNVKWQFLPLENISQVEIIKGASSVLYGSSALNGVINFRSADASNLPQTRFYTEAGVYGKPANRDWIWWNSPRFYSSASFSHLRRAGNTSLGISAGLLLDQGYRKLNDEKIARISVRLKHNSGKISGLAYGINLNGGFTNKMDFLLWEDAAKGALKQNPSTAAEVNGNFFTADPFISYKKNDRLRHDLRIRFQSAFNTFPVRVQNNSGANSLYSEYQFLLKLNHIAGLTSGFSGTFSDVRSMFYGDHTGLNIAAFSQIELRPLDNLKAVAGVRLEHNRLDRLNDKLTPVFRAGLNWQVATMTFLRASFGQGYRYPSVAEKYASTSLGSVRIFPNPDVKPESGWSSEIGIKQGLSIGNISGQADLALFVSGNEDMIEYVFSYYTDPMGENPDFGFQAANVEQSRVYGGEFEFTLDIGNGSLNTLVNGGYTFLYPVEYAPHGGNTGNYLKYRRKHSGKLSIQSSFKKLQGGVTLFARSRILNIDDVFLNPMTRENILPGFYDYWTSDNKAIFTADASLGYRLNSALSLSAVVKNLTNTEYLSRPGDIQAQRNFSLRLEGNF